MLPGRYRSGTLDATSVATAPALLMLPGRYRSGTVDAIVTAPVLSQSSVEPSKVIERQRFWPTARIDACSGERGLRRHRQFKAGFGGS